jgi:glycosyltransferase involved in cell wall biosynthesis
LAIKSALRQTYKNIEVVVVDDGSTDNGHTVEVARSFGDKIKFVQQKNRGVAGALNTALQHMTGDYFAWLSHDDIHLPHKTQAQVDYLNRLDRQDVCLFSDYQLVGPAGEEIATVLMIPIEIMCRFGPFDETLRHTQDYDFWNRILAEHEFFHQPEVLIQYRLHPGQDSQKPLAITEGDALWRRMLDSRSETERAQMFGSTPAYFRELAAFLDGTPYKEAAAYAHTRATTCAAEATTSVIVPFYNEVELARRAVDSVLDQIGARFEVILVDDGSTEDISPLQALSARDDRVRLLRQENAGPAAARNHGLLFAKGDYIAFLDADDVFLPHKISRQVSLMQRHNALFSHTSYYVTYPGKHSDLGIWRSGLQSGDCYPALVGSCGVATPTVMLHRSLIDEGFCFPVASKLGEDIAFWADVALRYLVLGIDEPLSIVEWSDSSAALSIEKQAEGLSGLITHFRSHPIHSRNHRQIDQLTDALAQVRQIADASVGPRTIDDVSGPPWSCQTAVQPMSHGRRELELSSR